MALPIVDWRCIVSKSKVDRVNQSSNGATELSKSLGRAGSETQSSFANSGQEISKKIASAIRQADSGEFAEGSGAEAIRRALASACGKTAK